MKMALTDGVIRIIEADTVQKTIIKSWNQMRWIRGQQMYEGIASAELLNKLATLVHLPPSIEAERTRMNEVQEAVDQERTREHPEPLYKYPVTKNLYSSYTTGEAPKVERLQHLKQHCRPGAIRND